MGIVTTMERRASPENPSTSLANPAAWFIDWATGGKTKAGVKVDNAKALGLSAVYAAIRRISDDVAKLPLHTFERLDRGRRKATEHHLYVTLKDRPNPAMSSYTFWEVFMGHVLSWGNGYAEIERNGAGRVEALWPLRPDRMEVKWTGTRKVYIYQKEKGEEIPFTQDEVFHVPGFGFDGLVGYNPIHIARESLALTAAAEQFGAAFFGNGSRASGVLKTPETLTDEAFNRLRKSWEEQHRGVDNAHRIAILEEGLDWTQIGIPPEEAQFLQTRQFQVREVARWFQIAPHKISDLADAHFNNIESQSQEYLNDTIQPWVERIERAINWDLFPTNERGEFYARFMIQALLRPDSQARAEYYSQLFNVGALSPNDILELEERNPVEGGDQRFVPLNMVPLAQAGEVLDGGSGDDGPDPDEFDDDGGGEDRAQPPGPQRGSHPSTKTEGSGAGVQLAVRDSFGDEKRIALSEAQSRSIALRERQIQAHRGVLEETAQRALNRELRQVRRAVDKAFGGRDQQSLRIWLDEFYSEHNEAVTEYFQPVLMAFAGSIYATAAEEVGGDPDLGIEGERFVREYARILGIRWSASSRRQLQAILRDTEPEDVEQALQDRLDDWEEGRAEKSATRESVQAGNAVTKMAYGAAGVQTLRWVARGENCAYCQKMNGRIVGIRGAFVREGEEVDPEVEDQKPLPVRHDISHPPLHRSCDCSIVAVLGG